MVGGGSGLVDAEPAVLPLELAAGKLRQVRLHLRRAGFVVDLRPQRHLERAVAVAVQDREYVREAIAAGLPLVQRPVEVTGGYFGLRIGDGRVPCSGSVGRGEARWGGGHALSRG